MKRLLTYNVRMFQDVIPNHLGWMMFTSHDDRVYQDAERYKQIKEWIRHEFKDAILKSDPFQIKRTVVKATFTIAVHREFGF